MNAVRVTVPCSTSNLGAGFDCMGLAFDRYLTVTYEPSDELAIERRGTLGDIEAGHDIVASLLRSHGLIGNLTLESNIPIGKGLGSSAAATVAALAIAASANGEELNYDVALDEATMLEGHPDNAAPALLGGLVAVVHEKNKYRPIVLYLSEDIAFVYAAPQVSVSTKSARQALPAHVSHQAAVRTISRSVALVEGLAEADPQLLRIGFHDELHVPYRISMIPGGVDVIDAAVRAGAWAATISGSGSGLIAVCSHDVKFEVLAAMSEAFEEATRQPPVAFLANPDLHGLQVEKL